MTIKAEIEGKVVTVVGGGEPAVSTLPTYGIDLVMRKEKEVMLAIVKEDRLPSL